MNTLKKIMKKVRKLHNFISNEMIINASSTYIYDLTTESLGREIEKE